MKYIRVTLEPELSVTPQIFRTIAASSYVNEARLLNWTVGGDQKASFLLWIEGEHRQVRDDLEDAPEVIDLDLTEINEEEFHGLFRLDPSIVSFLQDLFEEFVEKDLIPHMPVVYKDAKIHATIVGNPDDLQSLLDTLPPVIDVSIHEVGEFRGGRRHGLSKLSERQREAVLTALELGYYEVPRQTTHREIADRLGCAESTVTEHLQKAEAKLMKESLKKQVL